VKNKAPFLSFFDNTASLSPRGETQADARKIERIAKRLDAGQPLEDSDFDDLLSRYPGDVTLISYKGQHLQARGRVGECFILWTGLVSFLQNLVRNQPGVRFISYGDMDNRPVYYFLHRHFLFCMKKARAEQDTALARSYYEAAIAGAAFALHYCPCDNIGFRDLIGEAFMALDAPERMITTFEKWISDARDWNGEAGEINGHMKYDYAWALLKTSRKGKRVLADAVKGSPLIGAVLLLRNAPGVTLHPGDGVRWNSYAEARQLYDGRVEHWHRDPVTLDALQEHIPTFAARVESGVMKADHDIPREVVARYRTLAACV
jgi:hypothetical protein